MAAAARSDPQVHPSAFLAPGAVLIGQVTVGRDCFVGPNCVLRGDIEPIIVADGANLQDNVTVHTHKGSPVTVGPDVSVGHGAVVHGATLEAGCLVGMNAVVLDHAVVGEEAVVGALTLVPARFQVPPRSLAVGIPCQVKRHDDAAVAQMARDNGRRYHGYLGEHRAGRWGVMTGPRRGEGDGPGRSGRA